MIDYDAMYRDVYYSAFDKPEPYSEDDARQTAIAAVVQAAKTEALDEFEGYVTNTADPDTRDAIYGMLAEHYEQSTQ
jgi:hypothetical protein